MIVGHGAPWRSVLCWLSLSKAHVQIVRWSDEGKRGKPPPLSREEAMAKAADYAKQADELLAEIDEKK